MRWRGYDYRKAKTLDARSGSGMTEGKTENDRIGGACGRGCAPVPQILYGGEDCLSEASSAAHAIGTGVKAPPWGHALAPMVLGPFAETKGPRRAGAKPRMTILFPHFPDNVREFGEDEGFHGQADRAA